MGLFGFDLHDAGIDLRTGGTQYNQTKQLNGKNILSSVSDKVRSLREKVADFFAPRGEFALAIA